METRIIIEVHSPDAITIIRRAGEASPLGKVVPVPEIVTPVVAECINAKDAEIARLTAEVDEWKKFAVKATNDCENMGRISEALHARNDEIVGLRAEVERLEEIVKDTNNVLDVMTRDLAAERDALQAKCNELEMEKSLGWHEYDALKSRYDALQARIDAGVRVYSIDGKDWSVSRCLSDNHSATLIIDQPDAAMVDERKGEEVVNCTGVQYRGNWLPFHDRRRVAGTRADRGQA